MTNNAFIVFAFNRFYFFRDNILPPSEYHDAAKEYNLTVFALIVATVVSCVYILTLSPSIGWLDSPEFVAASIELGVAHSPGHPLVTQLGNLGALLPGCDLVWGVNLMGALTGGLAAGATALFANECIRNLVPDWPRIQRQILAGAAGFIYAFCRAGWEQGTLAEVYSLEALFLALGGFLLLRWHRTQTVYWLYLCALTLGLALANHSLITVAFFIPAAVFVFCQKHRPGFGQSLKTAGFGIVGLLPLIYLPIRSLQAPLLNWGAPHVLSRFWWTVSGQAFFKCHGRSGNLSQLRTPPSSSTLFFLIFLSHSLFSRFLR